MTFYSVSETVRKRISDENSRCTVRLLYKKNGQICNFPEEDIISFELTSYRAVEGGIITRGKIELDDIDGFYTDGSNPVFIKGLAVQIWFCFGSDNEEMFKRCVLYVGEKGFESLQYGNGKKHCIVELADYSFFLGRMSVCKEWDKPLVLTDCKICDKNDTENSLVHILAKTNVVNVASADSINLSIDYCECTKSLWKELSEIALIYRVHLECEEKEIIFVESEYGENAVSSAPQYSLFDDVITHLHSFCEYENYANDVLVKYRRKNSNGETEIRRIFSCSETEIEKYGRVTARKSGNFISDSKINGMDFEKLYCDRWLEELSCKKRVYYITTFIALVNARVDAFMNIRVGAGRKNVCTRIDELTLCFKKNAAFETRLWLRGD